MNYSNTFQVHRIEAALVIREIQLQYRNGNRAALLVGEHAGMLAETPYRSQVQPHFL